MGVTVSPRGEGILGRRKRIRYYTISSRREDDIGNGACLLGTSASFETGCGDAIPTLNRFGCSGERRDFPVT